MAGGRFHSLMRSLTSEGEANSFALFSFPIHVRCLVFSLAFILSVPDLDDRIVGFLRGLLAYCLVSSSVSAGK